MVMRTPDPWNPAPIDGNCIGGELHEYQLVTIQYDVPTKNDVLIGPEYAVWSPGQDPLVSNGINYYYPDVPADGGYNHFELRRHKRAYTLPGVFTAGQEAPPMEVAALWLNGIFQ
jgi:hypothetical protein